MNVEFVEQSHEILHVYGGVDTIAEAARTCYRSEAKGEGADERLVRSLIRNGHDAMLEFAWMVVRIVCDRSIAQEITRHRLFSFAMESQRYVNSYDKGFEFILPGVANEYHLNRMKDQCLSAARSYSNCVDWSDSLKPEIARYVLPNATATTIVVGGNVREWRHFFRLRCDSHAHPMMRKLARNLLNDAIEKVPVVFDDLEVGE